MWMSLEDAANITSVLTFFGAAFAYIKYLCDFRSKPKRLETYLHTEKQKAQDHGLRTALQITREIGLTSDEIIQASFKNRHIGRRVKLDDAGLAERLLFVYEDTGK